MPKVSVLVPVYKARAYIARCARSLFGQSFGEVEFLFVDDCTPDDSIRVLEEVLADYPLRREQVRILTHARNRGSGAARNTLIDAARGEYLLFVDSDDYLIGDEAIARLYAEATAQGADLLVYGTGDDFGDKLSPRHETLPPDREAYTLGVLLRRYDQRICGKLIARRLFGPEIRFPEGLNFGEDYAVLCQLAYRATRIAQLDATLYGYVLYNASSICSSREQDDRKLDNIVRVVELLTGFFAEQSDADRYTPWFGVMQAANKVILLKETDTPVRKLTAALYPQAHIPKGALPLPDRLVLWLADRHLWGMLDRYVRMGLAIKKILK